VDANRLPAGLSPGLPLTALAPMQDVTDLAFMGVIAHYGAPDYFFTEFFRVHAQSKLENHILRSIDENATGRPVFAQLIGEDLHHLARSAAELQRHPVAGVDGVAPRPDRRAQVRVGTFLRASGEVLGVHA